MELDSTIDIITALQSCGLTSLRLQRAAGSNTVELSERAANFFGTHSKITFSDLARLGPETADDTASPTLGSCLAARLSGARKPPAIEVIACKNGERLLCVNSADSIEFFRIDPAMESSARRELRHRFRNNMNTIVMNIELISMLARQADHADIARAADRIEEECRDCIDNLELL